MWYVTQTSVDKEYESIEKCRRALDESVVSRIFTPVSEMMKKYQGEWHITNSVLFPGYIFLESDTDSRTLEKLLWRIPGVVTPVKIGGGFNPITKEEEIFLREMMDENYHVRFSTGYIVDNQLVIKHGPLDGKTALVRKIDRHKRLAMMDVSIFQETKIVKVGLEVVAKLTGEEYAQMKSA